MRPIQLGILLLMLASCGVESQRTPLTVYAAASLTESFTELAAAFEAQHPDVAVLLSFGGSNQLRTQIEQGAPADVFASASTREIDALVQQQLIAQRDVALCASNRLVVLVPADNPANITTIADLSRPKIKLVVADERVPVGSYTMQMLAAYGADFQQQVIANIVSQENDVKQVAAKVRLGEADAGIVYATDARAVGAAGLSIAIPEPYTPVAHYPLAIIGTTQHRAAAEQFVAFVLSDGGQAILQQYGFGAAP